MNRIPLMVGAAIAGLMLLGLVAICAERQAPVAPGHAVDQRFDAGRISVDLPHKLIHRFEFRNDTNQTLEISELKTSCGCTGVDAPVRSLKPGESGWIEATAMIQGSGQFETVATIRWSSGEKTRFGLSAFSQVSHAIFLSAGSLDMNPGESRTVLLTWLDQDGMPPGRVEFQTPDGMEIKVGAWQTLIQADVGSGVVGRFCATLQVDLNTPLDQIAHLAFSLASFPAVQSAQLTIRTPALVEAHARAPRTRGKNTGPIVIPRASEPVDEPSPDAPVRR